MEKDTKMTDEYRKRLEECHTRLEEEKQSLEKEDHRQKAAEEEKLARRLQVGSRAAAWSATEIDLTALLRRP